MTTVLAIVATLVFAFVPAGSHSLSLHSQGFAIANDAHAHDNGGHSHDDDLDLSMGASDAAGHHHADHTHEKVGLVAVLGDVLRTALRASYLTVDGHPDGGPPHSIDRPPRSMNLV
ncbi:MAG: hypothetical protein ACYC10_12570 [Allorhizobium sp.]